VFRTVLVANRGEIALRVIRACRALGIRPVAVYSDADASAPHVRAADASVHLGPAPAEAARATGAEAIHPGVASAADAHAIAAAVGYPVMLKAASGGGGIGMALVADAARLDAAFAAAQRRAQAAFGDGAVYVERALEAPRHVEVQVLGDEHGTLVHLYERDCSIQRRHQKLVEESPAPALPAALRMRLHEAGLRAARAARYRNAGTVEFLVEGDAFYFLEMNTRLQVEHPVTEEVTGLDLVEAQLRIAAGERLAFRQSDVRHRGAAIECRIYAEDTERGFLPSPGTITALEPAAGPGIRHECGVEAGSAVTVHYDPLLAKVIAAGADREQAIERLTAALDRYRVEGVRTTLPLHRRVMASPAFRSGHVHTRFLEREV